MITGHLSAYFEKEFKPQFMAELTTKHSIPPPLIHSFTTYDQPHRGSKAATLSISCILKYHQTTCLHASVLIEGNMHKKKDFVQDLSG